MEDTVEKHQKNVKVLEDQVRIPPEQRWMIKAKLHLRALPI